MQSIHTSPLARATRAFLLATCVAPLGGCAVVTAVDTAASLAISGVGLAADAAIGTVRLTGKAIGATADLAFPEPQEQE